MTGWTLLDPFNQPLGPYTEEEITEYLVNQGDCYVIPPGGATWELASEALTKLQSARIAPPIPEIAVEFGVPTKDDHGQPLDLSYNRRRRADRDINELLGLAKGLIADGALSDSEVVALRHWLDSHEDSRSSWPVGVLADRVERALEDGLIDDEERGELLDLLEQVCGARPDATTSVTMATRLAFDTPPPTIHFHGRAFAFTGKFLFGTRKQCQAAIEERGGIFKNAVYPDIEYLVVGTLASRDWAHTAFGRKVEEALAFKARGSVIAIVAEEHWCNALGELRP